jgi:hypothetical protein
METVPVYTLTGAAQELGIGKSQAHHLLQRGLLQEVKGAGTGRIRLVSAASVLALKTARTLNPPRSGRRPKEATDGVPTEL